jgi:hypothetical protein
MKKLKFYITLSLLFTILAININVFAKTSSSLVTLSSVKLLSNSHVGNQWSKSITVNGRKLVGSLRLNGALKAKVKIVERDKIPDIGIVSRTLKKGKNIIKVTVIENRGRYSGHKAVWQVVINVR